MKIYIMTDMEGVAGVLNAPEHIAPDRRCYQQACELTTLEANAAIEGALEAGASEFLVVDGHGYGAITPALLHPKAKLLAGRPLQYPFGCDDSFDAAFIIGQHARSNADGGHLSHTGSFDVEEVTLNSTPVGELAKNLLFAAYFHVPTVFVSGDEACSNEAKELIPSVETAIVKWGVKRGSATGLSAAENEAFNGAAIHLTPARAREVIREGARQALQRRAEIERYWVEPPYELMTTLRPNEKQSQRRLIAKAKDLIDVLNARPTEILES